MTETKFFMLALSSHNMFNFLPFTLIQLSKFVMPDAIQTTAAEIKLSKTSSQNQVTFPVLSRKTVKKNPAQPLWLCQVSCDRSDSPAEAVIALSPGASAPVELLEADLSPSPYSGGQGLQGGEDGSC